MKSGAIFDHPAWGSEFNPQHQNKTNTIMEETERKRGRKDSTLMKRLD